MNRFNCLLAILLIETGCAQPNAETTVATAETTAVVAFNVARAPTVEFNVPDMMCPEGCGEKTKEILSEQPGAKEVVINFDAKTAIVAVETDKFNAEAAVAALVDHGFENSSLKSDDSSPKAAAPAEQPSG